MSKPERYASVWDAITDRSGRRHACIGSGRTIRPNRPIPPCGKSRWPASDDADTGAKDVPGGRRGRVVERCRPTPELARSSAFGTLTLGGFEQLIQRTGGGADGGRRDGHITGGGIDAAMAQQRLDDAGVHTAF